jgi:hypothetical protein
MIGVVHLVWAPLGPEPLREFLRSYHAHPCGAEHELSILLNGAGPKQPAASLRKALLSELSDTEHRLISLERPMLDLAAYAEAARRLKHERLCFLNSYSVILADDWLAKLDTASSAPGVGLVGATGSWASARSQALHARGLPSAYRAVFPDRRWMREQFRDLQRERAADTHGRLAGVREQLNTWRATLQALRSFPPFPAPHVRTNAFMIDNELLLQLRLDRAKSKLDAYQLESGRRSITRQVSQLGLRALVVDAQGTAFQPEEWDQSRTFWQHEQEGLMVADNQTRTYALGGWERRVTLSRYAWGSRADPAPPGDSRTNTDV